MIEPRRVLDLFCGAGGAAMGLHRAWPNAEIVGVDIKPQPRYPFTFWKQDVMQFPWEYQKWDFIWASPPCQAWTVMQYSNRMRKDHPKLITPLRKLLERTGCHYVIENVPGAPIKHPKMLCGLSFGLRVLRHRLFETSFDMLTPEHPIHPRQRKVRGKSPSGFLESLAFVGFTTNSSIREFRAALGVEWMTMAECRQAIPPAYSEYIARQFSSYSPAKREENEEKQP